MTIAFVDDAWHPLSGVPAPEYIPPSWIGPHVGLRLVEALRTLRRIPVANGPRECGGSWPTTQYTWTDQLAQLQGDPDELAQDVRRRNWTKIIPSSEDIARM